MEDFKSRGALLTYLVVFVLLVVVFTLIWFLWGKKPEPARGLGLGDDDVVVYRTESATGIWVAITVIVAIICVYLLASKSMKK